MYNIDMTKFYIVRHGQTDYNKEHRILGRLDIPLNETGIEQAKNIADSFRNVHFDAIYYSPLTRAKQTASEILKKHGNAEFIEAPEIIERDFGDYGGESNNVEPPYYGLWDYSLESKAIKGGESMEDIKKRVFPFLDKLLAERKNQNVCLVCHGGVGLIIREYFEGMPESKNLLDFSPIPNGEAIVFEK